MAQIKETNLTAAYLSDGSVLAAWDLTPGQLEELRDDVIPILIERTKQKTDRSEFTIFSWPPDTSRMDRI